MTYIYPSGCIYDWLVVQWAGHIENYFSLSCHYYNIIILERWVIACVLNYTTVSLIYSSLMCSIFWYLDNTRQYCHISAYDYHFKNYLSFNYDCNSCIIFLGPILGWHSIHIMGGCIEEHHRVWLGVTLHRHGTHLFLACLLIWESLCLGDFSVL